MKIPDLLPRKKSFIADIQSVYAVLQSQPPLTDEILSPIMLNGKLNYTNTN